VWLVLLFTWEIPDDCPDKNETVMSEEQIIDTGKLLARPVKPAKV